MQYRTTLQSLRLPVLVGTFVLSTFVLLLSYRNASILRAETLSIAKATVLGDWSHDNASVHANAYQLDAPPEGPPWGAIVSAARSTDDLSWMMFIEQNWTTYPYNVDNPENEDVRLQIPVAKGHEAMVYLTWIINNYDSLPWYAVFVHGHRDAWHQVDDIVRLITDLQWNALARAGYVSLRCDWYPSCPAEIRPLDHDAVVWGPGVYREDAELAIAGNWRQMFPSEKLPETIASPCCAQFAVTRQSILRRPKADYERLQHWLINTLLIDEVSGRVLEKLWAYIFTGEAVHCPLPSTCACKYFGHCEEREWPMPPEGLSIPSKYP